MDEHAEAYLQGANPEGIGDESAGNSETIPDIVDVENKPPEEGSGVDALQNLENKEVEENSLPSAFEVKLEEGEDLDEFLKQATSELMSDFNTRHTWRYPYEYQLWYEQYRQFFNDQLLSSTPTRSKVYVPVINQIIRVAASKLAGFVTSSDDIFDTKAKSPLEENIAENIKLLIGDQLDQNKFSDVFSDLVLNLLLYGTAYLAVDWYQAYKHIYEDVENVSVTIDPISGQAIPHVEQVPTKMYKCVANRPRISVIDILDVYPAQNYANVEDQPGIFIRRWMNLNDFRDMLKEDDYFGNNTAAMKLEGSDQYQFTRQWRKVSRGEMATVKFDQVELLEYWGPFDLDGDGIREECQMVIANRAVCVRAVANPFHHQKRPLIKCVCNNVAGEWYGQSLIQPVLQMQEELNTIRRQHLDAASLSVNRMWKVKITSNIDESQLVNRPNGIVYVENMDDMVLLEPTQIPQDSFADAAQIQNDMFDATIPKSLTGTVEDLKGGTGQPGSIKLNLGQALERFAVIAQNIQAQALVPMLEMMYQLDLQFLNSSEIIRSFYGNLFSDPSMVTPAMIRGQVEFEMKSLSEMINRDSKVQQLIAIYQVFGQSLDPQSQQFILKQTMELLGFDASAVQIAAAGTLPIAPGGQTLGGPLNVPANIPRLSGPTAPMMAGNASGSTQMGLPVSGLPAGVIHP